MFWRKKLKNSELDENYNKKTWNEVVKLKNRVDILETDVERILLKFRTYKSKVRKELDKTEELEQTEEIKKDTLLPV